MTLNTPTEHPESSADTPVPLDALPRPVAVVNSSGDILCANQNWLEFAREIGIDGHVQAVGMNYDAILRMTGAGGPLRESIWNNLETQKCDQRLYQYDSDTFAKKRRFEIAVSGYQFDGKRRYLISQEEQPREIEMGSNVNRSQNRMEQFAEHVDQLFWMIDLDYQDYSFISSQFEEIWGFPADEMESIPEDFLETVHPDDRGRVRKALNRQSDGDYQIEYRIVRPDGEIRWIRDRAFLVELENDGKKQIAGISEDITQKREVNRDLKLFRESLDRCADAIYIIDPETGNFIYANQSVSTMLGYTAEALEEMNVHDINPEMDVDSSNWERHVQSARENSPLKLETVHQSRDGSTIPVEIQVDYLEVGKRPRMVAIVRDITDRVQKEEALKQSERRFRQMAENIDEVFWMQDVETDEVLYVSPAVESIWGRPPEEFYEDDDLWLKTIVEDDRAEVIEAFKRIPQNGFDVEYHIERPDGEIRCVRDHGYPVENSDGELNRIVGSVKDITDQCQVEEKLREKAEFLEAVNDRLPGVTYQFKIDPDGNFSFPYMSQGHEQLSGVSSKNMMDSFNAGIENVHPDDRESLLSSIEEISEDPGPWKQEYRYQHPDQGTKWVVASSIPQQQPDGSIIWYGVIFDITDRKRIERDLRLKKRALASTSEGISIADARQDDNPLIYVNEGFEQLTGYDAEEVLGGNCRFLQGPSTSTDALDNIRNGIEQRDSVTEEIVNYRKDGTKFWNELSINPIYDDDDNLTHYVGIQKNVTERKQAEQSLARSERRFRNLVERIEQVFWVSDSDFESFKYVSPLYEEWWDQPVEKLYDNEYAWVSAVHPDDVDDLKAEIEQHIVNANSPEEYRKMEQEFRIEGEQDDEWRWCYASASPITSEDGSVKRVIGLVSDITDHKETQQALSESLEQKSILVQEVHHRVKNNLQVLLGLLSLQSRRVEGDYAQRALSNSKQRVQSMALIHEKLYESSNFSTVNVQEYLSDLINHIIQTSVGDDLDLNLDVSVDVGEMGPDTIIPCGLIVNELVSNAIEHGFDGHSYGDISVKFYRRDEEYHLVVSDNGNGTPPDELFETGTLGLTLVENLSVNQLHGQIDVENNDGLSVHIAFPVESSTMQEPGS